uniref:Uncharacterized protein n=1 Tax=Hyaloperonospora arabidopsidis (strain Emoy2) TaxID=559515 RepID=M4C5Y3_HYAAE
MKCVPIEEKVWKSVEDLNRVVQVVEMTNFIRQSVAPKEMASLVWSSSRIFGTVNFFTTIRTR